MARQPALRRVRQERRDQPDLAQPGQAAGLGQAAVGQRDAMVDEVPVGAADEADVRLEDDRATAGSEQATRDRELLDDRVGAVEVLEVVAHEDGPERPDRQVPFEIETVRLDEVDVGRQLGADVAQVRSPAVRRADVADEVAGVAGDVEDRRGRVDPLLEVPGDLRPDHVLLTPGDLREPLAVDVVEPGHLDPPGLGLGPDPRDDLVEHLVERRRRLEPEDLARLADIRARASGRRARTAGRRRAGTADPAR